MAPLRAAAFALDATVNLTAPAPWPDAGDASVIHAASVFAAHSHSRLVEMVSVPAPPFGAKAPGSGRTSTVHFTSDGPVTLVSEDELHETHSSAENTTRGRKIVEGETVVFTAFEGTCVSNLRTNFGERKFEETARPVRPATSRPRNFYTSNGALLSHIHVVARHPDVTQFAVSTGSAAAGLAAVTITTAIAAAPIPPSAFCIAPVVGRLRRTN